MSLWLNGIGVSRGVAIGRAQRLHGADLEIPERALQAGDIEHEITRFYGAQRRARDELRAVREQIPPGTPGDIAAFIDTHLLMMDDRSIVDATIGHIRGSKLNAEAALKKTRDAMVAIFDQMDDPYLRTRKDDVGHVVDRIQRVLMKLSATQAPLEGAPKFDIAEPTVIVSDDITPADIILLSQQKVVAFITEFGGPTSHTAILARSLGIPAIVGLRDARKWLRDGETVIVDGEQGHALAAPDAQALEFFRAKQIKLAEDRATLQLLRDKPAVSKDGVKIRLLANIESPDDAIHAAELGAEGVGLYRTEFLYMNRKDLPSEEEQFEAYAKVVSAVKGPLTIRTLDLGADKQVDSGARMGPTPNNPALGLRAIRLCLKEPELFRTQVRALLRASRFGEMKIMLPMISSVAEYRQAHSFMAAMRIELTREGYQLAPDVPVGAMIEIPAAALASPMLARECQFFSIGTNDLIQYTLAIDRVDDEVNYLYDPLHPAVLQLIQRTIESGARAGIPVTMCGEMAGDVRYTRLLLGLGLTEFSMHPANVLEIKRAVLDADVKGLQAQVQRLLASADIEEQQALIAAL
ncbi:MAG: phosphoenolpyruvate--protein phosphotransferase [Pseudomonadota bacterium]